jgi:polypeptide N-acetylgalactosaminyltransferase
LDDGGRRIFNWDLAYRKFPKKPEHQINPHEPFPTPTMIGSAYAINRLFFWDIGAYDHGLKVWQGEQLEMSFKGNVQNF